MEKLAFKYGNKQLNLAVPDHAIPLEFREPVKTVSEEEFLKNLFVLISDRKNVTNVAVVVADKTRLCGYERILPWVVEVLQEKGITQEGITFYIAYGTHPRQTDEECRMSYGDLYDRFRFVHHDCNGKESFTLLGTTGRGTEVKIRKDVLSADLILTIGAISHHYFAGYGGGRKLLFPGLAEKEAIYANHRLFLDREHMQLAAGCWPGLLEGNPLAEDLREIHRMLPAYVSIHALLNSSGSPARYFFGKSYDDFLSVCKELDNCYKVDVGKPFDLVVVSAGGYPKDINMIQSHKAIHNAANLVGDGGTLIVLAECVDGVGSKTFLPYFEMGGRDGAFSKLIEHYEGNGGTALAMMEKTERIRICMVTALPDEICLLMNTEKITAEKAETIVAEHNGSMAVVQNGSMLVTERGKHS